MVNIKLIETFGSNTHVITDSNRKLGTMLKRSDNKGDKAIHQLMFDESMQSDQTDFNAISNETANEPINRAHMCSKELRQKVLEQKSKIMCLNNIDLQKFEPFEFINELCDPVLWRFIISLLGEKVSFTSEKIELEKYNQTKILPCLNIISCLP